MGAIKHGEETYKCYDDCRMEGCPGHHIALYSKHGGYYVIYLNEEGEPLGGNRERHNVGSMGFINAVSRILERD